jgi:hypothetical protein
MRTVWFKSKSSDDLRLGYLNKVRLGYFLLVLIILLKLFFFPEFRGEFGLNPITGRDEASLRCYVRLGKVG